MAGGPARGRDEDEAEAALLHRRRAASPGAAELHGVLEDDVPLLVDAVEGAHEEAAVVDSHQHAAEQQALELSDGDRATGAATLGVSWRRRGVVGGGLTRVLPERGERL